MDRQEIVSLPEYLFTEGFAYSLFGEKPITLSCYYIFKFYDKNNKKFYPFYQIAYSFYNAYYPKNIKLKNSWDTWKKYKSLFSNSNFIFLEEPNSNSMTMNIIIINKKAFIETLNINKDTFEKVLKIPIDPKKILDQIINGKMLCRDIIKNHEALLGILLGYGNKNSWDFYERKQILKKINLSKTDEEMLKNINEKFLLFAAKDNDEIRDESF